MASRLDVFVTEEFQTNGENRKSYTKVGTMFPHKKGGGYNILIKPHMAVCGTLVAFVPREKENGPQQQEAPF